MGVIEDNCRELWELLNEKAPNLRPKIIPRGYDDKHLKKVWRCSEFSIEQLENYISNYCNGTCSICGTKMGHAGHLMTEYAFDFDGKTLWLKKLFFLCDNCFELSNTEEFLCSSTTKSAEIHEQIGHFCKVNQFQLSSPLEMLGFVEECYSLAYSLKVLLNSIPNLNVLNWNGSPLGSKIEDWKSILGIFVPYSASGCH